MKTLLTTLLTFITILSFSQKLDKFGAGLFYYIQPPSNYVLDGNTSYSVEALSRFDATRDPKIKAIYEIEGLTKVAESADLTVKVSEMKVYYSGKSMKSEVKSKKNKDGTTSKYTQYHYVSTCSYSYQIVINNKEGASLYTKNYSSNENITGSLSTNKNTALSNYNSTLKSYKSSMLKGKLQYISSMIDSEIAYMKKSTSTRLVKFKGKKYNYDELNLALEGVSVATKNHKAPRGSEEIKQQLKDVIVLLKKNLEEKDLENKKARVNKAVTAGLTYDIGVLQFMIGEYEEAKKNLEEAMILKKNVTAAHISYITLCTELIRRVNAKS